MILNFRYIYNKELALHGHPAIRHAPVSPLYSLTLLGVQTLISLDTCGIDPKAAIAAGLDYYHIPVNEYEVPELKEVEKFIKLVDNEHSMNRVVSAHCRLGIGRAGIFGACFLLSKGIELKDAIKAVWLEGHPAMLDNQTMWVVDYATKLTRTTGKKGRTDRTAGAGTGLCRQ